MDDLNRESEKPTLLTLWVDQSPQGFLLSGAKILVDMVNFMAYRVN